jgi:CRP-like cAMP-binding protein
MTSAINYLEQYISLCDDMTRSLFLTFIHVQTHPKRSLIACQDKKDHYCYVIRKGLVRGYYKTNKGEVTDFLWQENDVFGYPQNEKQDSFEHYYQALELVELYCIPLSKWKLLVCNSRELANLERLMLVRNINKLTNVIISKYQNAKVLYHNFEKEQPELLKRVPLKYIASYLGVRSETLSRIRKEYASINRAIQKP